LSSTSTGADHARTGANRSLDADHVEERVSLLVGMVGASEPSRVAG
jgi:hypothetical protein